MDEEEFDWEEFTATDEYDFHTHPFAKYLEFSLTLCAGWLWCMLFVLPIFGFQLFGFAFSSIPKMFSLMWKPTFYLFGWIFAIGPIFVFCRGFGEAMTEWSKEVGFQPTDEKIAKRRAEHEESNKPSEYKRFIECIWDYLPHDITSESYENPDWHINQIPRETKIRPRLKSVELEFFILDIESEFKVAIGETELKGATSISAIFAILKGHLKS
jgi:hypothetical protein